MAAFILKNAVSVYILKAGKGSNKNTLDKKHVKQRSASNRNEHVAFPAVQDDDEGNRKNFCQTVRSVGKRNIL